MPRRDPPPRQRRDPPEAEALRACSRPDPHGVPWGAHPACAGSVAPVPPSGTCGTLYALSMITPPEESLVTSHAYVPEHVPGYVRGIAEAEPYLLGDYLCYCVEHSLIFIGYPLRSAFDEAALVEAVGSAISRFRPRQVALAAPDLPSAQQGSRIGPRDAYYRLDLSGWTCPPKVGNMLRRASREVQVEVSGGLRAEHLGLIAEFLDSRRPSQEIRYIFQRVPAYVSSVGSALVFSARDRQGVLVAFDVAEFGARDYAFYLFNFRSRTHRVPGSSDLLLHAVITTAKQQGKAFVNLGLGISRGVTFFKEKWGGRPFLGYEHCRYQPGPPTLLDILWQKL